MRNLTAISFLLVFLLTTDSALSQKKCRYQFDTAKILANHNLDNFLTEMKNDSFKITNKKKDIPKFIKKQLDCYTGRFRIADPDQPYNPTDVNKRNLPKRQLTFLAKSADLLIMRYHLGGFGLSSHLLLVKYRDGKIIDLWKGIGLLDIKNIQDVIRHLELNRHKEWGLNTNMVTF